MGVRRLVVLPGMDGTGQLLAPFVRALGNRAVVDVHSYPTQSALGYDELISRVRARLPDEDYAILAESFAGPIGMALAREGPRGLRGLALVVSFAIPPRSYLLQLTRILPMARILGQPIPCWVARRLMLGPRPPAGTLAALCDVMHQVGPAVIAHRLAAVRDVRPDARRVQLPALYIQAANDWILPASALEDLRPWLPRLEVHRIPGPHLVLDTSPVRCADLVAGFLAGL
jgi:pimeloyl-ACP methyl ester carboxylesterase